MPADLDAVHALCDPRGIDVVEDAACALGAEYRGVPIGGSGGLVAFSFHPRKIITTGEGGMVMTAGDDRADRMRRLRDHGADVSAWARHDSSTTVERYVEPGFNFRLSDLLAAVGLVQLERLDEIVTQRRALAAAYQDALRDLPLRQVVTDPPWGRANYQSFWIELADDRPGARDDGAGATSWTRGCWPDAGSWPRTSNRSSPSTDHAPLPVTERLTRAVVDPPALPHDDRAATKSAWSTPSASHSPHRASTSVCSTAADAASDRRRECEQAHASPARTGSAARRGTAGRDRRGPGGGPSGTDSRARGHGASEPRRRIATSTYSRFSARRLLAFSCQHGKRLARPPETDVRHLPPTCCRPGSATAPSAARWKVIGNDRAMRR